MLSKPLTVIETSGVIGAPIKFKWNDDLSMELYDGVENVRLFNAINTSSVHARMALAACCAEWIIWRLKGHADIGDALLRLEAAWASAIHPAYAKDLEYTISGRAQTAEAVLELTLAVLGEAWEEYTNDAIWVATHAMKLSYVAKHVIPTRKQFDDWLSSALRRLAKTFPRSAADDEDAERYDPSEEAPVPRQIFETGFELTKPAIEKAVRDFTLGLDPKKNPYLRPSSEMKAAGVKGKAY